MTIAGASGSILEVVTMPAVDAPGWPLWQRIGFRYLCLHWLLYAMPSPLSKLFQTSVFGLTKLQSMLNGEGEASAPAGPGGEEVAAVDLTSWAEPVSAFFASVGGERIGSAQAGTENGWWRDLTSWVGEFLGSINASWQVVVPHQMTGSGDTTHDWIKFGCIVVFAAVGTVIWSVIDRRRCGHPVLGRWVHLAARWYLALVLVGYGMAKFYMSQFPEPGISGLTREIGDHSPMGIVWTFMGLSTPYKYMSGVLEILAFALLLHHRTVLLGCFVTLAVMGNICALNILYSVPVKLFSVHLWLIAFFLMAPFAPRLWALFISNRFSESVDIRVVKRPWLAWPMLVLGTMWAVGTVWQSHANRMTMVDRFAERNAMPELYGLYTVEEMSLDGVEVPSSDSSRWRFLAIDKGNRAWAKTLLGTRHSFSYAEDVDGGTISLTPMGGGDPETWTFDRSMVTRKVRNPSPTTIEEFRSPVDGEREQVVWKGRWSGKDLELLTVRKVFRVHDPRRLIREFPR